MDTTIEHLTEDTFAAALEHPEIVVIDFWAARCGARRALASEFEQAAARRPNHRFAKVDVDREPALARRYVIRSIPTLLVFRDGALLAARSGVVGTDELVEALDRVAAATVDAAAAMVSA